MAAARTYTYAHINPDVLTRMLQVRGKAWSALNVSAETRARIRRGEPVQTFIVRKIADQLTEWPKLEHAEELLQP